MQVWSKLTRMASRLRRRSTDPSSASDGATKNIFKIPTTNSESLRQEFRSKNLPSIHYDLEDDNYLHSINPDAPVYWSGSRRPRFIAYPDWGVEEPKPEMCWDQPWFKRWVRDAQREIDGPFKTSFMAEMNEAIKTYTRDINRQLNEPSAFNF